MVDKVLKMMGKTPEKSKIAKIYNELIQNQNKRFVGYVMNIGFVDGAIITNDYWKITNGGIPQNSFLLLINEGIKDKELVEELKFQVPPHIILARVTNPTTTPMSGETSKTYYELHKASMPALDIFTKSDLQWAAMEVSILGTFYDHPENGEMEFGGDIHSFWSPHHYKVYVPEPGTLECLINAYVKQEPTRIGKVRLTETMLAKEDTEVVVNISAKDFIGARTALFGKTRMGKSNTVKKIISSIMDVNKNVSMVIFDLNGEYANTNEQDDRSIYDLYSERCERFTLRDNPPKGFSVLKANFYKDIKFGHEIIKNLYAQMSAGGGDYIKAFLDWEILDDETLKSLKTPEGMSAYTRYQRCLSMYKCLLYEAGFKINGKLTIDLNLKKDLYEIARAKIKDYDGSDKVEIGMATSVYQAVWEDYIENKKAKSKAKSKKAKDDDDSEELEDNKIYKSSSGRPYFDETMISILTLLSGTKDTGTPVSGKRILIPFKDYHDQNAGNAIESILTAIENTKCVILDLSNAPEELYKFFSDYLAKQIFSSQMKKFTTNSLGDKYVQFFFEEAHNLFPSNDKDLKNIYNRLAKEGAKLNIGIAYSTQSISSLSPDLLKNTENFFIAHLNDDREIRELTRFHEFRDVGYDVQRTKTRGFVRMITRSHKFAIPVQIDKF